MRVENRYVQNKPALPVAKAGCTGVVVIEVKMNQLGMVGSATVASGTTIIDEDVLYSCKEAALKTDFAYILMLQRHQSELFHILSTKITVKEKIKTLYVKELAPRTSIQEG